MDTPQIPQPQAAPVMDAQARAKDVEDNKDMAALGYLWVLSIVIFLAKKNSPFARYHAKQGIVLFLLSLAFWMVPGIGQLLEILVLAGIVIGFAYAAQGQWKDVPVVGPVSRGEWGGVRQSWRDVVQWGAKLSQSLQKHWKKPAAAAAPASASTSPTPPNPSL